MLALGNGVTIELLVEHGDLRGLGGVWAQGVALRNGAVPLAPYLKSDTGVLFTRFRLERTEPLPEGGYAVHTTAIGIPTLESAYEDEYNGVQALVGLLERPLEAEVVWLLRPEALQIQETGYTGFSYAWRYRSTDARLFRVLVTATWEIGGAADGNTVLSTGQVTPPVYVAEKDTHFTSACLKQLTRFGDPLGMSFQLTPRFGLHQPFDFLGHARGTLLGCWPEKADVRAFLQKNPGEDVIFVVDATHFPLTDAVEIPRKCILFAPADAADMPEHVLRNRWKDAHDHCGAAARAHFQITRSRPLPESTIGYGTRLMDDGSVQMRVGDAWVPSQEWLIAMADTYFAELAARGIRRVIPQPIVQTDPSERGRDCKLHRGIHGDLNVGSVCCVHRYVPADMWGGMAAWQYYYRKAHAYGMEVGHWIGPHLSYHAPIVQEHPDWVCRTSTTLAASGGYPNFELACMNWNTGVRRWIFEDIARWKAEGGLDYVWFDSLGNLGMVPVDFSQGMQPSTFALAEFIADLQRIGIANIAVEGVSPFGVAGCGMFDPNQGQIRDAQAIVGQNTLDWLVGNEDMWPDQQPRIELHRDRTEEEARQIFFRFLASRTVPMLGRFSRGFGPKPAWFTAYLDTYFAVEDDLVRRLLLPGRQAVRWTGGGADVLFAFAPVAVPAAGAVERIDAGVAAPVAHDGTLRADPWTVHRLHR